MTTLIDVHMPHMGSVENIVLTTWLKSPGDRVQQEDPLCEVSTDKVDTEVSSPASGVLVECLVNRDDEVAPGSLIARFAPLDANESDVAAALGTASIQETPAAEEPAPSAVEGNGQVPSAPLEPEPVAAPAAAIPADASLVLRAALVHRLAPTSTDGPSRSERALAATPLVRKIAKERGLDLATITGTGPGGRITRKDVEAATWVAASPSRPAPAGATGTLGPTAPEPETPTTKPGVPPTGYESVAHDAIPLTPQRRAIARNLRESVSTAPQLTAQVDVDMSAVGRARETINNQRLDRGQRKLSYVPFIARALCAVVAEHPDINATFTDTHLLRWRPVNLGIAVDARNGLFVPVVRHAERLALTGLADAITEVTTRVLERKATSEDLVGGTITISNSGSVGGVIATPILTRPQVASLGVPAIIRQPVVATTPDGEEYVAIRPIARLGLTFDHRAFDGAQALRALQSLQNKLENWSIEAYR